MHNAQSGGAGGVQVNAYARDLQITNNLFEANGGQYAGAIAIGVEHGNGASAAQSSNHNEGTVIAYDRVEGNGAKARAGGIAIFYVLTTTRSATASSARTTRSSTAVASRSTAAATAGRSPTTRSSTTPRSIQAEQSRSLSSCAARPPWAPAPARWMSIAT